MKSFDPRAYGDEVAALLALAGDGQRPMALQCGPTTNETARRLLTAKRTALFAGARFPEAALSGLLLYFDCWDDSHKVAQNLQTVEGSYWHAIVHRREPDDWNSNYWFQRVPQHPVFPALREAAAKAAQASDAGWKPGVTWDAAAFIKLCAEGRRKPGSPAERLAVEIQRLEWQLLFDYCASPR